VINRAGVILTNAHVISGAVRISVAFREQPDRHRQGDRQGSGRRFALLKVNPDG